MQYLQTPSPSRINERERIADNFHSQPSLDEEIHQQIEVFLRAEHCFEYAIYLGVYAVFHCVLSSMNLLIMSPHS